MNRRLDRDPLVEIEVGVRGDTAASLGHAARKLKEAIAALAEHDRARGTAAAGTASARHAGALASRAHPGGDAVRERRVLLHRAADALWAYVVQREMLGITDNGDLPAAYSVSGEMWSLMGAAWH